MARYVNADAVEATMNGYISDSSKTQSAKFTMLVAKDIVEQTPSADVVERSEYEKLRLVNLDLAETNKGLLAEHEQLEKLRSKINAALEEIEKQKKLIIEYEGESDLGVAIKIIRECLGEVKE